MSKLRVRLSPTWFLYLDVNKDRFLFDTAMGGPVFGFTSKF